MTRRYARQMAVDGYGAAAQRELARARVLVIGAGGLGATVLPALAGAGVGQIRIIDPDRVELTNLHRQTLFTEADIGAPKAQVAAQRLAALNSGVDITAVTDRFDPATGPDWIACADLVLDCADSFAVSYAASDLCLAAQVPLISASVTGQQGYVGGFCGGAPGLRAVFPDLPDRAGSCSADGVLGPAVAMVGALQAQMALAVLTGQAPSPLGQMVTCDLASLRFGGFRFDGAENPAPWPRFVALSQVQPGDLLIDLRDTAETGPALTGARRSGPDLDTWIATREPARIALACRTGLRAWHMARQLDAPGRDIALIALGD